MEPPISPEARDDEQQAVPIADNASIAELVGQINGEVGFAVIAQSILREAAQAVGAVEADLLAVEHNTKPLLRATIRLSPDLDPSQPRVGGSRSGTHLRLPVRHATQLIGLLDLFWEGEHQISVAEQRELDTLANLAALLIQQEQAHAAKEAVAAKIHQFGLHKEEFVHLVAHQLRTPLTSIKGFAQLLGRQQQKGNLEAIGRYSNTILQESNRLTVIVNNLMELSHMEVAMIGIRYAPFALNTVVEQTVADAGRGPQISQRLAANLPPCSGDRAVLKQALSLLIAHTLRVDDQRLSISTARADGHLCVALGLAADDWPERQNDEVQSISLDAAVDNNNRQNPAMSLYVVRNLTQAMGGNLSLERVSERQTDEGAQLRYVVSLPWANGTADVLADGHVELGGVGSGGGRS